MSKFIKLQRESKAPLEKLDITYSRREIATVDDVGILIEEPYVVVDIDDSAQAQKVLSLLLGEDLNCRIIETTRGIHCWFKTSEPMKNSIKSKTPLTIYADYKSWGIKADGSVKKSYVKVKQDGEWRKTLKHCKLEDLDEIPSWLKPMGSSYSFSEMGDGDGRNAKLYEYILVLQKQGFSKDEVSYIIQLINEYILNEPLDDSEIETILRDESFLDEETLLSQECPWFDEKNRFIHNLFADHLIQNLIIVTLNGQTYIYEDGFYQQSDVLIEQKMIELYPSVTAKQRFETMSYIKIKTHLNTPLIEEYVVNVKNGRLDLRTGVLSPHSPKYHDFQRVNVNYDPTICDPYVMKVLNKVFLNDEEVIQLFKQIVGYTLIRNSLYQTSFFLLGEGSNGKSTILDMIKHLLGKSNVSTLSLTDLESKFKIAELENKLANIGDDIPNLTIKDTGLFKKLTSGEGVTVERKNQHPFTLESSATLWFSTNKMPSFGDKSYGLERRMVIIPFNATFTPQDDDYDPDIREKVTTDQALTTLLNYAIEGLHHLRATNKFVQPTRVLEANEIYKVNSSSILTWADEECGGVDGLLNEPTAVLYQRYQRYCQEAGYQRPFSRRQFSNEITKFYNLESVQKRTGEGSEPSGSKREYYFQEKS